jgi:hypothetical protein
MNMKTWKKIALGAVLAAALGIGFIGLILPGMVEKKAKRWFLENTHRDLTVSRFSINPLTLSAEVRDLVLNEPQSPEKFISIRKIRVSLSPVSLVRLVPILSELRIDQPDLTLIRETSGNFNFSDLAQTWKPGRAAGVEPTRYIINNLTLVEGKIDYFDRSITDNPHHRIRHLNLSLPFVGNEPYLANQYVTPSLSGVFDESPIAVNGKLKPFADSVEASISLNFHDLDLPRYMDYAPPGLPVELRSGKLASKLEVSYRVGRKEKPTLKVEGQVTITGLAIDDRAGNPILFLPLAQVKVDPSNPMGREIRFGPLLIYNPEIFVRRDPEGMWNFPRFAVEKKAESPAPAMRLSLQQVRLRGGKIHFHDALPPGGFSAEATDIAVDLGHYSLDGQEPVPLNLSFGTERGEAARFNGHVLPQPLALTGTADLKGVPLSAYYPYLAQSLTAPVEGTAGVGLDLSFGPEGLKIQNGKVEIRDLFAPFGQGEGFRLKRFSLAGLLLDLNARKLKIASLDSEGGEMRFSRDGAGNWSPLSLLRPQVHSQKAAPRKGDSEPFSWQIDGLRGTGWQVSFRDGVPKAKPSFSISALDFSLENLAGPNAVPAPFQLKGIFEKKGSMEFSGNIVPTSGRLKVQSRLKGIPIADFSAYLPSDIRIIVAGGELDADVTFDGRTKGEVEGDFSGRISLRDLYCLDADDREDLLRLGNFQVSGIGGGLNPFSLHVKSVVLSDYYAKVVIDKNARLNLLEAFATADGKKKETSSPSAPPSPPPDIQVDAVTLQGGTVDFSDHHLILPFDTKMLELGGRISGLGSGADKLADVDLRGSLRNQSPLTISGKINPLGKDFFARLKMTFANIEMTPFTPYTGTYLGYAVEEGKLSLSLEYLIEHKNLNAQNKVFLDQFTLGERVESKQATSLPVKLAIALLKDRNGEIHLDLPVSGRTDNPQFSVLSVVWTILKNLLVKAATSPLSLLSAIFGGEEDFSSVNFPYGSAQLGPPEEQKLANLAKALVDRPGLKLEIEPYVDPEKDPEAYREEHLQEEVRQAKFLDLLQKKALPEGQTAEAVTVMPSEYPKYLAEVYRKADFPKPRNFFGMLKSLPDKEMEKLLLTHIPAGKQQMNELARARAVAVQNSLAEKGVPQERMFVISTDIFKNPKKADTTRSRVEFGVGTR